MVKVVLETFLGEVPWCYYVSQMFCHGFSQMNVWFLSASKYELLTWWADYDFFFLPLSRSNSYLFITFENSPISSAALFRRFNCVVLWEFISMSESLARSVLLMKRRETRAESDGKVPIQASYIVSLSIWSKKSIHISISRSALFSVRS